MTTSHLWLMLLALLLLATTLTQPAKIVADDCPDNVDHCQTQLTQVYLPVIANGYPMSSITSPLPTATPVIPPPVN